MPETSILKFQEEEARFTIFYDGECNELFRLDNEEFELLIKTQ